jgi:hypothetical protein
MRIELLIVAAVLASGTSAARAEPQMVAVLSIDGDAAAKLQKSIVELVGDKRWKTVSAASESALPSGVDAVVEGQLVRKRGHSSHLRLQVHEGTNGPVVASIDVRVGKKPAIDRSKRKQIAKQLTAALGKVSRASVVKPPPSPAPEAAAAAAPTPPPAPAPVVKASSGKRAAQAVDDEVPPTRKR